MLNMWLRLPSEGRLNSCRTYSITSDNIICNVIIAVVIKWNTLKFFYNIISTPTSHLYFLNRSLLKNKIRLDVTSHDSVPNHTRRLSGLKTFDKFYEVF